MSASMSPPGEGRPEAAPGQGGLSPAVLGVLLANHDRFLAFLARRVQPREVAEEILQEAFVRGIARGGALREDESAIAWFYRLLRNALVDHARGQSVEARGIAALAREADSRVEAETDQELVDTICACVTDLVGTLRPDYAAARPGRFPLRSDASSAGQHRQPGGSDVDRGGGCGPCSARSGPRSRPPGSRGRAG